MPPEGDLPVAAPATAEVSVVAVAPVTETPVVVVVEASSAESVITEPAVPTSILTEASAEVKPVETKVETVEAKAAEKAAEPKPVEAAPLEPIQYETFKFPENTQLDQEQVGKYTEILGKHQVPQDAAQALIDLYIGEQAKTVQAQHDAWNARTAQWREDFKNDPEIGGNRRDTTLARCGETLTRYGQAVGKEREAALRNVLAETQAGNHPELVRFVNWAANFVVESARPVAAPPPTKPPPTTRGARRYAASLPQINGAA